ncbi:MAG: hypothetical protein AB7Q17_17430 [Phycisphaerae bacterium]
MSQTPDTEVLCEECGATIYPEHLQAHTAERWSGRLLCPHCLREKRGASGAGVSASDEATVALVDEAPDRPMTSSAVRAFGDGGITAQRGVAAEAKYRRPLAPDSPWATRCKTFHCKLTDASIAHLNQQVNEWADHHDDVMIKFATTTVGTIEGKHLDPHLIVTVFY